MMSVRPSTVPHPAAPVSGTARYRLGRTTFAVVLACAALAASAQGLRLQGAPGAAPAAVAPAANASTGQRAADYIVAIVNTEPITNHQVRLEMQNIARNAAQNGRPVPDVRQLADEAVERLINDRAQVHLARESGIKVSDAEVNDAEASVARQNRIDLAEMQRRLAADGIDRNQFRKQLRDQLMVMRLRDRDVIQRVKVSEIDIDRYLREQQQSPSLQGLEMHLAQVLVALPDTPTPEQVSTAQAKANGVLERARGGADFAALARESSDAPDASNGGDLGTRPADRWPQLFVDAARGLPVGGLALVRSGAGFHVLKLVEKRTEGMPATSVQQTRASHILLRQTPERSTTAAVEQLAALRERIVSGAIDFATAARETSQDGSASQGGDLGWTAPGLLVPEFQEAMDALPPGQVSEPVVSRFGVHLIQVNDRRVVPLTEREQRDAVRAILRDKKADEQFLSWAQELRARAYVDMREAPTF